MRALYFLLRDEMWVSCKEGLLLSEKGDYLVLRLQFVTACHATGMFWSLIPQNAIILNACLSFADPL